jgi:hypothetical protein
MSDTDNGAAGASTKPGGEGAATNPDPKAIEATVRTVLGLKEGDSLKDMVSGMTTHAVKTVMGEQQKTWESMLDSKLSALKPKETPPPPPSDAEALKTTVATLQNTLKDVTGKLAQTEQQAAEERRQTKIADILAKAGIAPEMQQDMRNLAVNGLLNGVPKPVIDANGALVVEQNGSGPKPFESVLKDYLTANQYWLARHRAAGTGAGGANSQIGGGSTAVSIKLDSLRGSDEGINAAIEAAGNDPAAIEKAIADYGRQVARM